MRQLFAVIAVLAIMTMAGFAGAQTVTPAPVVTPTPAAVSEGLTALGLSPNIPNIWFGEKGKGATVASGVSVNFLEYVQTFSYGGTLDATLEGIGAVKVTGPQVGNAVFGATIGVDLIKLITGIKGLTVVGNWTAKIGPAVIWDQQNSRMGYGGGITFSYSK